MKKKKLNGTKADIRRSLSTKMILQMIIDWDSVTKKYEGEYGNWWKKYPSFSHNNVITEAKKKLNCA